MIGMTTILANHLAKYLDVGVVTESVEQGLSPPVVIVKNVSMHFDRELCGRYWGHIRLQVIYFGEEGVTDQEAFSVIGERLSFLLEEVAYSDGVIRAEAMEAEQMDAHTLMVMVTYPVRIRTAWEWETYMRHLKQDYKAKKEEARGGV